MLINRGDVMDIDRLMNSGLKDIKPYVGGKHKEEAKEKYHIEEPVKMSSNENPLGVSPRALEEAQGILPGANVYPEGSNLLLREAIAAMHNISPEAVMFGNGADEIIYYLAMGLINDGDEVIIPRLTFPIYEIACRMMRAAIVYSDMKGLLIDIDDISKRITDKTKLIALCNPNNPTGHALRRDDVYRFIDTVPRNVLIIMDEAYAEFSNPGLFPESVTKLREGHDNLFIIKTLSKAYGLAGFRVGYGIGDAGIVQLMNRIKLPFNISIVSQHAALGALQDHAFIEKTIRNTREGREDIYRAVERLGLSYVESSTNFILIDTGRDGDQVTEKLMKRGVIVRSAKNYGTPNSIRVTVGIPEQNHRFIAAMEEIFSA
jgi:histidinol-phosphate aminotransferase